jgi:hypothetical protein
MGGRAFEFSLPTLCNHMSDTLLHSTNVSHGISESSVVFICKLSLRVAYDLFNYFILVIRYYIKAIVHVQTS